MLLLQVQGLYSLGVPGINSSVGEKEFYCTSIRTIQKFKLVLENLATTASATVTAGTSTTVSPATAATTQAVDHDFLRWLLDLEDFTGLTNAEMLEKLQQVKPHQATVVSNSYSKQTSVGQSAGQSASQSASQHIAPRSTAQNSSSDVTNGKDVTDIFEDSVISEVQVNDSHHNRVLDPTPLILRSVVDQIELFPNLESEDVETFCLYGAHSLRKHHSKYQCYLNRNSFLTTEKVGRRRIYNLPKKLSKLANSMGMYYGFFSTIYSLDPEQLYFLALDGTNYQQYLKTPKGIMQLGANKKNEYRPIFNEVLVVTQNGLILHSIPFTGNAHESTVFRRTISMLKSFFRNYELSHSIINGKIISHISTDAGFNSQRNRWYLQENGFFYTVIINGRGNAEKTVRELRDVGLMYSIGRSIHYNLQTIEREVTVDGNTVKIAPIYQAVIKSLKQAEYERYLRDKKLDSQQDLTLAQSPVGKKLPCHDAVNPVTGEVLSSKQLRFKVNDLKVEKASSLDGVRAIEFNYSNLPASHGIESSSNPLFVALTSYNKHVIVEHVISNLKSYYGKGRICNSTDDTIIGQSHWVNGIYNCYNLINTLLHNRFSMMELRNAFSDLKVVRERPNEKGEAVYSLNYGHRGKELLQALNIEVSKDYYSYDEIIDMFSNWFPRFLESRGLKLIKHDDGSIPVALILEKLVKQAEELADMEDKLKQIRKDPHARGIDKPELPHIDNTVLSRDVVGEDADKIEETESDNPNQTKNDDEELDFSNDGKLYIVDKPARRTKTTKASRTARTAKTIKTAKTA